ncbi:hypothetical protein DL767_001716 [Monosporascus sp. MG133]|nr:hypothetical protein DL767_001716 [Monosporascus sp. MG133]
MENEPAGPELAKGWFDNLLPGLPRGRRLPRNYSTEPPKRTGQTVMQRKELSSLQASRYAVGEVRPATTAVPTSPSSTLRSLLTSMCPAPSGPRTANFCPYMGQPLHECGYLSRLVLPYWDWPAYIGKPLNGSTTFDGGPSSLSGEGGADGQRAGLLSRTGRSSVSRHRRPRRHGSPAWLWRQMRSRRLIEPTTRSFTRNLNEVAEQVTANAEPVNVLLTALDITDFQAQFGPIHSEGHIVSGP